MRGRHARMCHLAECDAIYSESRPDVGLASSWSLSTPAPSTEEQGSVRVTYAEVQNYCCAMLCLGNLNGMRSPGADVAGFSFSMRSDAPASGTSATALPWG